MIASRFSGTTFNSGEGRRTKLPQANTAVANKTSHGTMRANAFDGVASNSFHIRNLNAPIS